MALPLTVDEFRPVYGHFARRKAFRCHVCGGRTWDLTTLCPECERSEVSRWDYEGSGTSLVTASSGHVGRINVQRSDIAGKIAVGEELRELRKQAKFSTTQLQRLLSISDVNDIETGVTRAHERTLIAYAALALCPRAVIRQIGGAA